MYVFVHFDHNNKIFKLMQTIIMKQMRVLYHEFVLRLIHVQLHVHIKITFLIQINESNVT